MSANENAKRLINKFGKKTAIEVCGEVIDELREEIYEDSNLGYWELTLTILIESK